MFTITNKHLNFGFRFYLNPKFIKHSNSFNPIFTVHLA